MADSREGTPAIPQGTTLLVRGSDGTERRMADTGSPLTSSLSDYATASHAAATVSYPAGTASQAHEIVEVFFSLSGTTPAATLTITDGASTPFSVDVTGAGWWNLCFTPAWIGTPGAACTVSLSDGGSGVTGKVNVRHKLWNVTAAQGTGTGVDGALLGLDFSQSQDSMYL